MCTGGVMGVGFDAVTAEAKQRTLVMGILNVTPDSFSDGGRHLAPKEALAAARRMVAEGADIIDLGGESTRPGSPAVGVDEELTRVLPVARLLNHELSDVPWSIDTCKVEVAEACLGLGACLINDQSAMTADARMPALAGRASCGVCLMHRVEPAQTAQWSTHEAGRFGGVGVVEAVRAHLQGRARALEAAGVGAGRIWLDPGFGFGKTVGENFSLLRHLDAFMGLGHGVLVGTSRKSSIGAVLGGLPVDQRLEGTAATVAAATLAGAACVRVHDVKEMVRVVKVGMAIRNAE